MLGHYLQEKGSGWMHQFFLFRNEVGMGRGEWAAHRDVVPGDSFPHPFMGRRAA